jgi:uncharacterized protein (TIGR02217 family)
MSFIETPRFPDEVSAQSLGGPMYQTIIAAAGGGAENRNIVWQYPLGKWDITNGLRSISNIQSTIAFQRNVFGRAYAFRFRDPLDNSADETTGVQGPTGNGTGAPTYQLWKNYTVGSNTVQRKIQKPVSLSITLKRNGAGVTLGGGAGNAAIDYTTGVVTFVADATSNVSNIAVGVNTVVTLAANVGLTVGGSLYLSGLGGANAATLNNQAFAIVSAAPPQYTLSVNTANMTITAAGAGAKYPQPSDVLIWSGSFDVPVRFDDDWLQLQYDPGGLLQYNNIIVREVRL